MLTCPRRRLQLRLYQNMANGGPPAFAMVGPMNQQDRHGLIAARPVFQWHAQHEDLYVGQKNAARVLLLAGGESASYRGFFRLLSEQHIPFVVSENLRSIEDEPRRFDLVIAPSRPPRGLERYVADGGRLLVAGTAPPELPIGGGSGRRITTQGYWRVHDHALLPSLKDTSLLFLDGEYVELAPLDRPVLTLIPTAMFGPPEKVWGDKVETTTPGLVLAEHGKGRFAYIPWDVGGLYYRHSSQGHAGLVADVIDRLLPNGRQLKSNAHPLVEMTVMDQPARKRTLRASGERDGPFGYGVLSARRDERHPYRAGARGHQRHGRQFRRPSDGDQPGILPFVHGAEPEGLRGGAGRMTWAKAVLDPGAGEAVDSARPIVSRGVRRFLWRVGL